MQSQCESIDCLMVGCSFYSEREQGYRSSGLSGDEDGIDGKKKKKKKGLLFHLNRSIFYMYIVIYDYGWVDF